MTHPSIGLALSGGGFRATAFGLGALRALHDKDLLANIGVVSGISGGSLLAAMWAYGPSRFDDFDSEVLALLEGGLQSELLRRASSPIAAWGSTKSAFGALLARRPRARTRTNAFVEALQARPFGSKNVRDVTHPGLSTVLSATDLSTGNAVRFGSQASSCSTYGRIVDPVSVAEAVAASAAYPVFFPPLTRQFTFQRSDGERHKRTVTMTDGGVYDNLGLSPLLPGRSAAFTSHVYEVDVLVSVDAGRGVSSRTAARFLPRRMTQAFDITYGKTQDASRARIHALGADGDISGFLHVYLGMKDKRLPIPVADLVTQEAVRGYPTDLKAMKPADLAAVTVRGEQLTRTLLAAYLPQLVRKDS